MLDIKTTDDTRRGDSSRSSLGNLLESARLLVIHLDDRNRIRCANRQVERLTGLKLAKLLKQDWRDLVIDEAARLPDGGIRFGIPLPFTTPGGETRLLEWFLGEPSPDSEDATLLGVDVTERERALERREMDQEQLKKTLASQTGMLAERERFLSAIYENIPLMIFIKDASDLRFVSINRTTEEMLGLSRQEILGKTDFDLFPRDQASFFTGEDRKVLERRRSTSIKREPIDTAHLGQRLLHTRKVPILGEDGEPVYLLGLSEDITDQVNAEETLRQAKETATAASLAKTRFLANLSHEIRTPLNSVLGYSQLLTTQGNLDSLQAERVGLIRRSGEDLLLLIDDILEISRIEAGEIRIDPRCFDPRELARGLDRTLSERPQGGRRLELQFESGLPESLIADSRKLLRILTRSVLAIPEPPDGSGIPVRLGVSWNPDRGLRLWGEVLGAPAGIAGEEASLLFQPFQGGATRDTTYGTGIGLNIARQYARLMGGDLTLVNRPGQGSLFRFQVQVKRPAWDPSGIGPLLMEPVDAAGPGKRPEDFRILVVDDEDLPRQHMVTMLAEAGFQTREASDGAAAVAEFDHWVPHLVMMDLRMPGMDGHTAARRIIKLSGNAPPRILAVTGLELNEVLPSIQDSGFDGILTKPYTEKEVHGVVEGVLGVAPSVPPEADAIDVSPAVELETSAKEFPAELRGAALAALRGGYLDRVHLLLDQAAETHGATVQGLRRLVNDYEYDTLIRLLSAREGPEFAASSSGDSGREQMKAEEE